MSQKIIVISGKQLSGKDTIAKILLSYLSDFKRIGLGDAIKLEFFEKTGIPIEEIEKNKALYRKDLIELGNAGRAIDSDYWIKKIINFPFNAIVPDIRMQRELDFFKQAGAFTIRVNSSIENRQKRGELSNIDDLTETALDDVKSWDYVINNDSSFEDLKGKTSILYDYLKENFLLDDIEYSQYF